MQTVTLTQIMTLPFKPLIKKIQLAHIDRQLKNSDKLIAQVAHQRAHDYELERYQHKLQVELMSKRREIERT